jgi:two-component system OmpR family sensor kinase
MKSIRQQLLIGLLCGTFACMLVAGAATYVKVREEANELFDTQLRQIALSLPAELPSEPNMPATEDPEDDFVIQAWDRNGKLLYSSQPAQQLPLPRDTGFKTVRVLNEYWRVYGEMRNGRFVQAAQPTSVRKDMAAGLALRSLVPFLFLVPVLAVLIGVVVRRSLAPLHRVALAVRRRSPSALQPLDTAGLPPEVTPIIDSLNDLLLRLDRSSSAQRGFIADAAHELRSPLTALKLQLQLTERAVSDVQRSAAFTKLHDRLDRATHLVHQLLTLARHEALSPEQEMPAVDLCALAQQVVADKSTLAEGKCIDLGAEISGPVPSVKGHADSLRIMLNNLVDNAIRYTPSGGKIDVRVFSIGGHAALRVTDTGPGIPPADRERVFDRFYRRDEASASGSGLGLAIVKNIIEQHGAEISMHDSGASQGLTVAIMFKNAIIES